MCPGVNVIPASVADRLLIKANATKPTRGSRRIFVICRSRVIGSESCEKQSQKSSLNTSEYPPSVGWTRAGLLIVEHHLRRRAAHLGLRAHPLQRRRESLN